MLEFPAMAPMRVLSYCVAMSGDRNISIGLRRLGAGLLLLAALILPLNTVAASLPTTHDCDCTQQDQNSPCPAQMSCGMGCAGVAQLPIGQGFVPVALPMKNVTAGPVEFSPRSLRPDPPPPRA